MTREDIVSLVQEAVIDCPNDNPFDFRLSSIEAIERFAALYEQQMIRDGWRQCAEGQRTTQFCATAEAAIRARGSE